MVSGPETNRLSVVSRLAANLKMMKIEGWTNGLEFELKNLSIWPVVTHKIK
jgi:hypothetical protein